jgi:hypothetical protein
MLNHSKQNIKGTKMATKKKKDTTELWPKVIQGSHSTRTEYEDGSVDFTWDWEALQRDVREAIASVENKTTVVEEKPKRKGKK